MQTQALHILLVDDSQVIQSTVRHVLGAQGYRVDVACTGLEALDAIRREDYDAILMDIWMPHMDGLETMRRLCESSPASRLPPIIALTSATSPEIRERCFLLGMDDFLAKPVRGSVLIEVVRRLGSRGKADRERDEPLLDEVCLDGLLPLEDSQVRQIMTEVVVDGMIGTLQVWSDEEWSDLPDERRPQTAIYCRGLGWVGVVPRISLN